MNRRRPATLAFALAILLLLAGGLIADRRIRRARQASIPNARATAADDVHADAAPWEPLPAAPPFDVALQRELLHAAVDVDARTPPRTRHRRPDGSARYTNRLVVDASPYLLQHAHNPVDWQPWSDAAFARALAEHRPVLLSIGYSTCHWCHVMEEESFEDDEIAAFINANYVAIKVDREQRPDVDATYMSAVLAMTGNGGWPMTLWLTPTREAFYAATYLPPRDGDRGVRTGFLTLLRELRSVFDENPLRITQQASAVTERIRLTAAPPPGDALPNASVLRRAYAEYVATFDEEHGGFGGAPKFPAPAALDVLLRYARRTGDEHALAMVTKTLEAMAAGGIHDHVGGGFHRYATDAGWQVPHFEKMLTDNALLASVYLEAYQATHRREFADTARTTLDWIVREMTAPEGGFYTATDADSDGREGAFYLWTPDEIRAVMNPGIATAILTYYDVRDDGNFAGANILHAPRPLDDVAHELAVEPERLAFILSEGRRAMYDRRATRPHPLTDTKVVTGWSGLTISAFARAGAVLNVPAYVERARTAARFLLDGAERAGRLPRSWSRGRAEGDAFLDDYAFLAAGLVDLYTATFDPAWLRSALALHATMADRFWDAEHGGFFATAADAEPGLARLKPVDDLPVPSGNAVAAETLFRLAALTGDDALRARAEAVVRAAAPAITSAPTRTPRLLGAVDYLSDRPREVAIVHGGVHDDPRLLNTVHERFSPNDVLTVVHESDVASRARDVPLLADKRALDGRSTAYVCTRGVCQLPTSDPHVLDRQLAAVQPLPSE